MEGAPGWGHTTSGGGGTPLLHGVKVVSLSTVVAAPMTSSILAFFGADVVKVEKPGGDPWRNFFKEFERREFVSGFYTANRGKRSIVVDVKLKEDRQRLLDIIKNADVFITNTRQKALQRVQLDYPSLKTLFPQLIYVHITAWGQKGPFTDLPGYDLGAFWAMTGVSHLMHKYPEDNPDPGFYSKYPIAFGDLSTSVMLTFGIACRLIRQVKGGRGGYVHSSLFEMGYYALSPHFCELEECKKKLEQHPTEDCFYTADMKRVQLCACPTTERNQAVAGLVKLFGSEGDPLSEVRYKTRIGLANLHSNDLHVLDSANVPYEIVFSNRFSYDDINESLRANPQLKACMEAGREELEQKCVILPPFRLDCAKHGWNREPPRIGEHTKEIKTRAFPEYKNRSLPSSGGQNSSMKFSLEGINIVELSETGTTMASATRLLADQGANVTKVILEGSGADF